MYHLNFFYGVLPAGIKTCLMMTGSVQLTPTCTCTSLNVLRSLLSLGLRLLASPGSMPDGPAWDVLGFSK
jgi:hypothetical protein